MPKDIPIKELRARLAHVAEDVEKNGAWYRVIRRSKPSFYIVNIDTDLSEEKWETVVDFTNGGKTEGVPIEIVLKEMKKLQR